MAEFMDDDDETQNDERDEDASDDGPIAIIRDLSAFLIYHEE
jgi:hypothetical protein